jgi:serine/threonine protein phosphatase PrpC
MKFSVYQVSRRGGRTKNEDRMGYCYTRASGLFALADGMGGHPEGEVASQLALQTISVLFQRDAKPALTDPLRFLQDAVLAGHHQLLRYATDRALIDTPRTTIVACVLQGGMAYWAHCGDSRLYLLRGDQLMARTRDHSYTELHGALVQSGQATPAETQRFNRNVLFTCLGSPGKPVVDTAGPLALLPGDRIMLCSDGLWGAVTDEVIVEQMSQRPIADAVPELAEQALRNAGPRSDNVTVLALEWEGADGSEANPAVSTRTLGDEVFASTIQASLAAGDAQSADLDDAEIERSIREINDAIRRSAQKKP